MCVCDPNSRQMFCGKPGCECPPQTEAAKRLNRRTWDEIPPVERVAGYWVAIPGDADSLLDGLDYEIVYLIYGGNYYVLRPGEAKRVSVQDFDWCYRIPDVIVNG